MFVTLRLIRCAQCWRYRDRESFRGFADGRRIVTWCAECRRAYRSGKPRRASARRGLDAGADLRVLVVGNSKNRKHDGILATLSSASTCPPSCAFFGAGCYGEYHLLRHHWSRVPERGLGWTEFCARVRNLHPGELWRHNDVGDLPGRGDTLDVRRLRELVAANAAAGAHGFTFSHKPLRSRRARDAVQQAVQRGFTINLSANSLAHADDLLALGIAPVAVALPLDAPERLRTPKGAPVFVCPAQTARKLTCKECRVCARPRRAGVVGFRAHGQDAALVTSIVRGTR